MRMNPSGDALFYGDNLDILRNHIEDESVDLVYLDPPFNSNANYNVLFRAPDGSQSQSQIVAFDDTWHWTDSAESAFDDVMRSGHSDAAEMLRAQRSRTRSFLRVRHDDSCCRKTQPPLDRHRRYASGRRPHSRPADERVSASAI